MRSIKRLTLVAGGTSAAAVGAIGLSLRLAAPAGASGNVCVSINGTTRVDQGSSTCSSDTTSRAVAVNTTRSATALDGSSAIAVNGSAATARDGSKAIAVNDTCAVCGAVAFFGGRAIAVNDSRAIIFFGSRTVVNGQQRGG